MPGIDIITFGCRLNAYESEVMRAHADAAGLSEAVIVNTCAVTAEAVRQARQAIRKARRARPQAKIIVTGCAAQIDPSRFAAMDEVDHVVGNQEKLEARTFARFGIETSERVLVNDIMSVRETASHLINGFGARARAYVQIQNGCDHRCTFCIIPFGRGPSRSVPAGEVVAQVRRLAEKGYGEIVLTGVDITAYGKDLPGEMALGRLVRSVLKLVPELPRLRLSSIDSVEADAALLAAIADEERLMPHLHLSLQSGDDLTLKRMKRRHSRSDSVRFCEDVRRLRPDMVFGADLIAGFPTETDSMFANSLNLVDDCGLTFLHVFPFSAREGTPAARMKQVHGTVIASRAGALRAKGAAALKRHLDAAKGRRITVLMENEGSGRAADFTPVRLDAEVDAPTLIDAVVETNDGSALIAVRS
jgi:threonylcarbamoyladenosine tRNA methylthiotransferase MtaB